MSIFLLLQYRLAVARYRINIPDFEIYSAFGFKFKIELLECEQSGFGI
jgi:hypothetical protein